MLMIIIRFVQMTVDRYQRKRTDYHELKETVWELQNEQRIQRVKMKRCNKMIDQLKLGNGVEIPKFRTQSKPDQETVKST